MSKKHYSDTERQLFLNILKKYSHIIEMKKSDAGTLKTKEEAWNKICDEYNSSSVISGERTVKQLKKMWCNMKGVQRDNITKEKQSRLATGGGPAIPPVEVDPDIAEITPNLMTTAPTISSSNLLDETLKERKFAILDDSCTIEDLIGEINEESQPAGKLNENSQSLPVNENHETQSVVVENRTSIVSHIAEESSRKNFIPHFSQHKRTRESTGLPSSKRVRSTVIDKENVEEKSMKLERIRCIIRQEEKLGVIKKNHEEEKPKLEIQCLEERYKLMQKESELIILKIRNEREKHLLEIQYLKERNAQSFK